MTESSATYPFTLPQGTPITDRRHSVMNPARPDEEVGSYPLLPAEALDSIVTAAIAAQKVWVEVEPGERWRIMREAVASIDTEALAPLLVSEQGKLLAEAQIEVNTLGMVLDDSIPQRDWLIANASQERSDLNIVYRPFGVVGVISPWNWPIRIAANGTIPGLMAGNAVILHLPPSAPLAAAQAYGTLAAALPEGTLTILTHPEPILSAGLVAHPLVRKISFTGSTAVGSLVMKNAAETLTTVTLELGGNDPAIILPDLEPTAELAESILAGAFLTSGQVCVAIKRLYVPNARLDEYVRILGEQLDSRVVGAGMDPKSTFAPLHSEAQRNVVRRLVDDARAHGATVTEHGTPGTDFERGWFIRPTLVSNIDNAAALVVEEQFGPALPIIGYDTVEEAIALANDSEYGLGSSVWSDDLDEAYRVAGKLEAGMTWINVHGGAARQGEAPLVGVKRSGIGAVSAQWGIEAVMQPHAILR